MVLRPWSRTLSKSLRVSVIGCSLLLASPSWALPIGFGRNQGELQYQELKTDHFIVYHDQRTPHEGRVMLEALEAARPRLEAWLQVNRSRPLPVIMSATTQNPSFANFIVDAVELQTMGRGGRDLAWHEYTHSTMYRHLDNVLGPAGSLLHLPWMPAWWIEGLAETFSVSSGSDLQFGIERYYALNNQWPSYDKLHSLYDGSRFSNIGYAISGAFVSYIIRTYGAEKLPAMLEAFAHYSMPWWWPWSFVPFNGFMPMDEALREYTGKTGAELYVDYKAAAAQYWQAQTRLTAIDSTSSIELLAEASPPPAALQRPGQALSLNSTFQVQSRRGELYFINRNDSGAFEAKVLWEGDQAQSWSQSLPLPEDALSPRVIRGDLQIFMSGINDDQGEPLRTLWLQRTGQPRVQLLQRKAYISDIFMSRTRLIWFEEYLEQNRVCWLPREALEQTSPVAHKQIQCGLKFNFPQAAQILGSKSVTEASGEDIVSEIWFRQSEETLFGDRFQILRWQPDSNRLDPIANSLHGKPLSIAFTKSGSWLALADRNHHVLRRIDARGSCLEEREVAGVVEKLHSSSDDSLIVSLWGTGGQRLVRLPTQEAKPQQACRIHDEPTSPLQLAMRHPELSAQEIVQLSNPWSERDVQLVQGEQKQLAGASALGQQTTFDGQPVQAETAAWRPRPVFAFPWIGVDAKGYQIGSISVPLMDHMQNETLQLSALYGIESRYPNIELALSSNRFETSLTFSLFRRQTWNGVYRNESYYFDERGFEIQAGRFIHSLDVSLQLGYKNAYLLPYIGDEQVWDVLAHGYLREFSLGLNKTNDLKWASLSSSVDSKIATKQFNSNYDYEQLGLGLLLNVPIDVFSRTTLQKWGLSYGRVRGTRRKFLKEVYRPLRTFIPGSGGGLNEINTPLLGPGALTSAKYGDTQARFQFAWTYPIFYDMAKMIHIVYLQRLDFTAFYNYGTAWNNVEGTPAIKDGVAAHGYNLDLQADIKGVKVNLGLGTGQVFGYDFEVYFLFGFDALIEQGKN